MQQKQEDDESAALEMERTHVHQVYEKIALHFSGTRTRAWPLVERFLRSLPPASLVLDAGCGNGKYLACCCAPLFAVGCDRSSQLAAVCRSRGHECAVADAACAPFCSARFDAAISVAVVHHFGSDARRLRALCELARVVRPGGLFLVSVWAAEQPRFFAAQQQQQQHASAEGRDVFVPWEYHQPGVHVEKGKGEVFQRYYHLFQRGELERLLSRVEPAVELLAAETDHDNHYAVCKRKEA